MSNTQEQLENILKKFKTTELKRKASQWGVKTALPAHKKALIQKIIESVAVPSRVEAAWQPLTTQEKKMLAIVALSGGSLSGAQWYALGKQFRLVTNIKNAKAVFDTLNTAGLLFGAPTYYRPYYIRELNIETVTIPPGVDTVLSRYIQINQFYAQRGIQLQFAVPPDTLLRDLFIFWDSVWNHEVQLLKKGNLPKRFWKMFGPLLTFPISIDEDEDAFSGLPYAEMLLRLSYKLGLIRKVQDGDVSHIQALGGYNHVPAFWQKLLKQQCRLVIASWPKAEVWEFILPKGYPFPQAYSWRQEILKALGKMPTGTWLPIDALTTFLLPQVNNKEESLANAVRKSKEIGIFEYDPNRSVNQHSLPLLKLNLNHLVAIGILERGIKEKKTGKTVYWRLTPFGAALLANKALPKVQEPPWRVVIQPNFHIAAIGPVPINILARIGMLAALHKADTAVMEFQLTQQSIYPAFQGGMDWQQAQVFFEEISRTALSQNVQRSLAEWFAAFERIRVRPDIIVIQTVESQRLDRLFQNDEMVRSYGLHRLAPTLAVADRAAWIPIQTWLQQQNTLPLISRQPAVEKDSVRLEEDGTVVLMRPLPNIYLSGLLRQLCVENEGVYSIAPATVQKFIQEGGTVPDYIAKVNAIAINAMPPLLEQRLKAWAHYYGDASVETLTLLHFQDSDKLDELLQDKVLHPYLRRLLPKVPIAWVKGDIQQLTPLLAQRGITLHSKRRR